MKIKDICHINLSSITSNDEIENILYLDTSNLCENVIGCLQPFMLSEAPSRAQRKVKHKTILYSMVRPNQKHYGIMDNPSDNLIASTGFVTIDVKNEEKENYDAHFLYYILSQNWVTSYLQTIAENSVSSYPSINPSDIGNLNFTFPKIEVQRQIAAVLKNIDNKIALNRAINQNLEKMIADTMDYMFLSNKHLMQKRLVSDIAVIKAGGDCPTEWSKCKTDEFKVPIYSNGTDNEGLYGYAKEAVICNRSITVAARGTIGYCVLREGGYTPIIRLLAVTPNDIGGDVYLHQIFSRIKFKKDGSIQQQLTVPSLASIEIPYPNASELMCFAQKTFPIIDKIKQNKQQIVELAKQRDELLPLLMNGQVSVNSDLSHD